MAAILKGTHSILLLYPPITELCSISLYLPKGTTYRGWAPPWTRPRNEQRDPGWDKKPQQQEQEEEEEEEEGEDGPIQRAQSSVCSGQPVFSSQQQQETAVSELVCLAAEHYQLLTHLLSLCGDCSHRVRMGNQDGKVQGEGRPLATQAQGLALNSSSSSSYQLSMSPAEHKKGSSRARKLKKLGGKKLESAEDFLQGKVRKKGATGSGGRTSSYLPVPIVRRPAPALEEEDGRRTTRVAAKVTKKTTMPCPADTPASARAGTDTPGSTRACMDTPGSARAGTDTPGSTRACMDTPGSARAGMDTPVSARAGMDTPVSARAGTDTPGSGSYVSVASNPTLPPLEEHFHMSREAWDFLEDPDLSEYDSELGLGYEASSCSLMEGLTRREQMNCGSNIRPPVRRAGRAAQDGSPVKSAHERYAEIHQRDTEAHHVLTKVQETEGAIQTVYYQNSEGSSSASAQPSSSNQHCFESDSRSGSIRGQPGPKPPGDLQLVLSPISEAPSSAKLHTKSPSPPCSLSGLFNASFPASNSLQSMSPVLSPLSSKLSSPQLNHRILLLDQFPDEPAAGPEPKVTTEVVDKNGNKQTITRLDLNLSKSSPGNGAWNCSGPAAAATVEKYVDE